MSFLHKRGVAAWIPPRHCEHLRCCCMARFMSFPRRRESSIKRDNLSF
ncbi:MAG: hypothetical protein ACEY3D_10055 [Rickettsia sp.]